MVEVSVNYSQTGSCPDEVTCTLGDLDPGSMFSVVLTTLVDASVPDGTTITNLAEVFEDGWYQGWPG